MRAGVPVSIGKLKDNSYKLKEFTSEGEGIK